MHGRLKIFLAHILLALYLFNVSGFAVAALHSKHSAQFQSQLNLGKGKKVSAKSSDCQCDYLLHTAVSEGGTEIALPPKFLSLNSFTAPFICVKDSSRDLYYRSSRAPPVFI